MGSDSDSPVMQEAAKVLTDFGIEFDCDLDLDLDLELELELEFEFDLDMRSCQLNLLFS